jgi:flagellar biosynthesis/type III secretory pathway M-ring protein FliF/YscJ
MAFAFTAIKVNAEEIVEEDTPTIEEQTPTNPPINDEEVDNVTPPVDNTPTTDDNTQEEVDKVPTIVEQKTKEITDYVISLVVAFLGSSTFYAIVKALTNRGIKALTKKVEELEKQNKISNEAKDLYENKISELEKQLNQATDKMDVVLGQITNYLEVDANKQKQMAELLEKLLPPLTIEDSDIKEGE